MELIMKVNGSLIKRKARVPFGMLKVMSIRENSRMIWRTVMENILTSTVPSIKESLKTMFRKDMVKKNGLMVPSMWVRT